MEWSTHLLAIKISQHYRQFGWVKFKLPLVSGNLAERNALSEKLGTTISDRLKLVSDFIRTMFLPPPPL